MGEMQPIETAPKDGTPILAWCNHEADPYVENEETGRLTLYGAHAEGLSFVENGFHVVQYGGGWDERTYEYPNGGYLADWWFQYGSGFEVVANPTHWMPLPEPPKAA